MQEPILTELQYKALTREIVQKLENRFRIAPLNSLRDPRYRLKGPVLISVETADDQVIVSLDDVEAFAHAATEFEAMDALCEEIVQLFEDLRSGRESLGPLPRKWLLYLEEIIECR